MDPKLFKIAGQGKVGELHKFINKEKPKSLEGRTPKGNTALHIATQQGHTDFVVAICELCPSILLLQNSRGDTALHTAARAGHSAIVLNLIKCAEKEKGRREEMLKKLNMEHNTALHEAARNNRHQVASLLLEKDSPLTSHRNKAGASALCVAAEEGCLETIESILNASKKWKKLNWRGLHGRTPLHAAVIRQRIRATRKLLEQLPDFLHEMDKLGNYPIHYAVALGDLQMVRLLLAKDKSIADLGDKENKSPFLVAACNGHIRVMKELLLLCPHSGETTDDRNRNALHVAAERGNLEVVKYILSSNPLRELINEPDEDGNTPLHLAISNHHFSVSNLLIREKKVNVNVTNRKGMTALDIADESSSSSTSIKPYPNDVGVGYKNYISPFRFEPKLCKRFQKGLICKALREFGGKQVFQRRDKRYKEPRIESYKGLSSAISTVAGLIMTVSFAAAFTIPGGYNSDGSDKGKAVLAGKPFLWLFIMTDSLALFSSICVALLLFFAGLGDHDLLVAAISISLKLIAISLASLSLSFLLGLWLVLSKGLAIVVCLICIGVLFLTLHWFCSWFPLLSLYFKFSFPNKLSSFFSLYSTQSSDKHSHPEAIMDNGATYLSPKTENVPTYQPSNRSRFSTGNESRDNPFAPVFEVSLMGRGSGN